MSKPNVYDQLNAHTALVSASAILFQGEVVAKIVFKFPKDGMGKLYAYVHWIGVPMVRGSASGCGYDKKSAALAKLPTIEPDEAQLGQDYSNEQRLFIDSLAKCDDGWGWDYHLKRAGFTVCTII